jgi:hypothetical protein
MEALSRLGHAREIRTPRTAAPSSPVVDGGSSLPVDQVGGMPPIAVGGRILRAPEVAQAARPASPSSSMAPVAAVAAPSQEVLDGRPIRTWARGTDGTAGRVEASARPPLPAVRPLAEATPDALAARLDEAAAIRRCALQTENEANAPVLPEDGSTRVTAYHISYDGSDLCTIPLIKALGEIGRAEGFNVVVSSSREGLRDKLPIDQHPNVHPAHLPGNRDPWMEDHGEMSVDGSMSVPARIGDRLFVRSAIAADRIRRFYGEEPPHDLSGDELRTALETRWPRADFPFSGSVDSRRNQEGPAALATAARLPLRENLTHIEGGNLIVGKRADGTPYALVGRDSLAVSRALLTRDLGREVGDDEVRTFAARDLGLKPDQVFPVEQPHDFHIDMHMCPIGPGRILLHDSMEAARQQEAWLRADVEAQRPRPPLPDAPDAEWETHRRAVEVHQRMAQGVAEDLARIHEAAKRRRECEDRALLDLKAAGLRVDRAAGMLDAEVNPHFPSMNFFNAEQGTNEAGERFMIINGGPRRAEEYFARRLFDELGVDVARLHFLPREASAETLRRNGGINCRAKPDGYAG